MSGAVALHVMYAPRLLVGATQTRRLALYDATTTVSPGGGTYTLLGPDGEAVSGCSGLTVDAGAVSVPVPSGLTLGAGYVERWTTTIDGVPAVRTVDVVMQAWALGAGEVLAAGYHAIQRYPYLASLYAAGQASWDAHAHLATARVMTDLDRQIAQRGGAVVSRSALFWPALDALCAEIWRVLGAHGNAAAREMEARHEAAYSAWWDTLSVQVDTDGDGAADAQRTPDAPPGGAI